MDLCTVGSRLFGMLKDELETDVTFVVQGVEVKCHRLVLRSCQQCALKDMVADKQDVIDIGDDIAPHTFKTVLNFMYTDNTEVTDSNVFQLLHAAKAFSFAPLERLCSSFICQKLNANNIGFFTGEALKFEAEETLKLCGKYFGRHTQHILKLDDFSKITEEALLYLCSSEKMACSELDLFLACLCWAMAECKRKNIPDTPKNLRTMLGPVLFIIRFPCMTSDEFVNVIRSKVLTSDEVGQVTIGFHDAGQKPNLFSAKDRTAPITVKVKDPWGICRSMAVPLTTSIQSIKGRVTWRGCADLSIKDCHLKYKEKKLVGKDTLSSCGFTYGEEVVLEIYAIPIKLCHHDGTQYYEEDSFMLPLKNLVKAHDVIKEFIFVAYGYKAKRVQLFVIHNDKPMEDFPGEQLKPGVIVYWIKNTDSGCNLCMLNVAY